uniref:Coiled-coil domain containing 127a n=1 Tax=Eptatretus burgeri TaxID=7764 RepID=A0A8C4QEX3_EPTBU
MKADHTESGPHLYFYLRPTMNNLNNPRQLNIIQDGDAGAGGRWNYALLVPMLSLAAFRWVWSRECQREVEETKKEIQKEVEDNKHSLNTKYQHLLSECSATVAHLELQQEKMVQELRMTRANEQKHTEERCLVAEERASLCREREVLEALRRREAVPLILEEEAALEQARDTLNWLRGALMKRQEMYCSLRLHRHVRRTHERVVIERAKSESHGPLASLHLDNGIDDIFQHDTYCAKIKNVDPTQNGSLMWLYLKHWELQLEVQKLQKVNTRLNSGEASSST